MTKVNDDIAQSRWDSPLVSTPASASSEGEAIVGLSTEVTRVKREQSGGATKQFAWQHV